MVEEDEVKNEMRKQKKKEEEKWQQRTHCVIVLFTT
jgi:hypothetical protein